VTDTMPVILKNNVSSTLATAITASDTAIVVADGSQFPALVGGGVLLRDAGVPVRARPRS